MHQVLGNCSNTPEHEIQTVQKALIWIMIPCSLVDGYEHLEEAATSKATLSLIWKKYFHLRRCDQTTGLLRRRKSKEHDLEYRTDETSQFVLLFGSESSFFMSPVSNYKE
jgi:hypothetical protein